MQRAAEWMVDDREAACSCGQEEFFFFLINKRNQMNLKNLFC